MAFIEEQYFENDPSLDWEQEKRSSRRLARTMLERRLTYWREKQEQLYLEMYRTATSI